MKRAGLQVVKLCLHGVTIFSLTGPIGLESFTFCIAELSFYFEIGDRNKSMDVTFTFHNQANGNGLHSSSAQPTFHLAPQDG